MKSSNPNIIPLSKVSFKKISVSSPEEDDQDGRQIINESSFDCPICWGNYQKATSAKTLDCKHRFCKECMSEYLKNCMTLAKVAHIKCPYQGCQNEFSIKDMEKMLDQSTLDIYRNLLMKKTLYKKPEEKLCPHAGCSRPLNITNRQSYTLCQCGTKVCNTCCNPWHEGKTCLEAIDPEFEVYAREEGIKFCIMCKTYVERVEGCKHITCPVCDYEWCWDCGRQYSRDHEPSCPKEWSPLPPNFSLISRFRFKWDNSSVLVRIGLVFLAIILSPFLLFGFVLFWPLKHFKLNRHLSIKKPINSLGILFLSILISISVIAFVLPVILLTLLLYLLFAPCILTWKTRENGDGESELEFEQNQQNIIEHPQPRNKNRWTLRNSNRFGYTANSRPEAVNNNNHQQLVRARVPREEFPAIEIAPRNFIANQENNNNIAIVVAA